jgi:hypothetical protein
MAVFYASVNSYISLTTQLDDGSASLPKVVKATVRSKSGTVLLNNQVLTHIGNGLFAYSGFQMPDESVVIAQYSVYFTDGTTLDTSYTVGTDSFIRATDVGFGGTNNSGGSGTYVILDEFVVEVDIDEDDVTVGTLPQEEQEYVVEVGNAE